MFNNLIKLLIILIAAGFAGQLWSASCPESDDVAATLNALLKKESQASKIIGDDIYPSPKSGRWMVAHIEGDLAYPIKEGSLSSSMGLEKSGAKTFFTAHKVLNDYVQANYKICIYYNDTTGAFVYLGQKPGDESK